jgi:hypothetical protein
LLDNESGVRGGLDELGLLFLPASRFSKGVETDSTGERGGLDDLGLLFFIGFELLERHGDWF